MRVRCGGPRQTGEATAPHTSPLGRQANGRRGEQRHTLLSESEHKMALEPFSQCPTTHPTTPHDTRPQTITTTCPRLVLDIDPRPSFTDSLRRCQLICPLDFTVLCICRLRPPSYSFSSPPSSCPVHSTLPDSIPLTVEWRSIAKSERDRTRH